MSHSQWGQWRGKEVEYYNIRWTHNNSALFSNKNFYLFVWCLKKVFKYACTVCQYTLYNIHCVNFKWLKYFYIDALCKLNKFSFSCKLPFWKYKFFFWQRQYCASKPFKVKPDYIRQYKDYTFLSHTDNNSSYVVCAGPTWGHNLWVLHWAGAQEGAATAPLWIDWCDRWPLCSWVERWAAPHEASVYRDENRIQNRKDHK